MSSGYFITFEGGDGAGKTTLIEKLYETLNQRGLEVIKTRAPGGTEVGKRIRELILHPNEPLVSRAELFLFLADRAQHVEEVIVPALERGHIVLCDRYNDSTIAYQGGARGFELQDVEALCFFATRGLVPHLTLYLDLDPEIGMSRNRKGDKDKDQIEAEDITFHQKIRKTFHQLADREPERLQLIDASKTPEAVYKEALKLIDERCISKPFLKKSASSLATPHRG